MSTSGAADVDQIRHRAYQLWNEDGCPEGRAVEYWLRAEAELGVRDRSEPDAGPAPAADEPAPPTRAPKARSAGAAPASRKATPAKAPSSAADVAERQDSLVKQRRTRNKAEG